VSRPKDQKVFTKKFALETEAKENEIDLLFTIVDASKDFG